MRYVRIVLRRNRQVSRLFNYEFPHLINRAKVETVNPPTPVTRIGFRPCSSTAVLANS